MFSSSSLSKHEVEARAGETWQTRGEHVLGGVEAAMRSGCGGKHEVDMRISTRLTDGYHEDEMGTAEKMRDARGDIKTPRG